MTFCLKALGFESQTPIVTNISSLTEDGAKTLEERAEEFVTNENVFNGFLKNAADNLICDFRKETLPIDPGKELRQLLNSTEGAEESIDYFVKICPSCTFGQMGGCDRRKLLTTVVKTLGKAELINALLDEFEKVKPISFATRHFFPIMSPSPFFGPMTSRSPSSPLADQDFIRPLIIGSITTHPIGGMKMGGPHLSKKSTGAGDDAAKENTEDNNAETTTSFIDIENDGEGGTGDSKD